MGGKYKYIPKTYIPKTLVYTSKVFVIYFGIYFQGGGSGGTATHCNTLQHKATQTYECKCRESGDTKHFVLSIQVYMLCFSKNGQTKRSNL